MRAPSRVGVFLLLTLAAPSVGVSEPPATRTKKVHDISDLVANPPAIIDAPPGNATVRAEALVRWIQQMVEPRSWDDQAKEPGSLTLLNENRLEVVALPTVHQQLDDVLGSLRRLIGVVVVFEAELYQVAPADYRKRVEPLLKEGKNRHLAHPISEDAWVALRKLGPPRQSSRVPTPALCKDHNLFTVRKAVGVWSAESEKKPDDAPHWTVFEGFSLRGDVAVSADRRSVRIDLVRKLATYHGLVEKAITDPSTGKKRTVAKPEVRESSTREALEVEDGDSLLLPLVVGKDSARFALVRVIIHIDEEERERGNNKNP